MRSVILAFAVTAMLAACGSPEPEPPAAAPPAATAAPETPDTDDTAELQERISTLPAPYNAASYEAGRRVFAQCRSCHTAGAGEPNRVGPNLHGLFGREAGSVSGFAYSPALQEANFIWDEAKLDQWLNNPREFLPGNRMAFAGVRDETQRRDLIAFLHVEGSED